MKSLVSISCLFVLGFGLAGCFPLSPPMVSPQNIPQGIEGQWTDSNGITSSFRNGVFETRAPDTQEKLSEGNYVLHSPTMVSIEIRSHVSGTVSQANCALVNTARLLCTKSDGGKFALNRAG